MPSNKTKPYKRDLISAMQENHVNTKQLSVLMDAEILVWCILHSGYSSYKIWIHVKMF